MKKHRVAACAAVLCLLLSGCSGLSLNGPDILTPPNAEGDQAEIQQLIRNSVGKSYEMVYPEKGEYKSSVIFKDLTGDGVDEGVAMYTPDSESVRILIAGKDGDSYRLITEGAVQSPRLERVEFADLYGDGTSEVIVSCKGSAAEFQTIAILSSDGKTAQKDYVNACADHLIGDMDSNGRDDLLTLALADGENLPTARLFTADDGELSEIASCEIASDTREYVNLLYGKISSETVGAVIDARDLDGNYSTQIICYDYNAPGLVNPLYVGSSYNKTKRASAIASADIDRDDIIEIPLCNKMDFSSNEDSASVCDRIDWCSYNYAQLALVTKQSAILCDRLGFILNLAPEHADIVTARYTGENSMSVYLWEYKGSTPERTTKLVTIKRYDRSGFDENSVPEAIAGRNSTYVYTYVIDSQEGFYGYTDDEVTNNFVILEGPSAG